MTQIIPDARLLAVSTETAQNLAEKPIGALRACKRLMKAAPRPLIEQAMSVENEEFSSRVRSADAKEALAAFLEKCRPNFTRSSSSKMLAKGS